MICIRYSFLIDRKLLNSYGCIEVKQRAGCLSYIEDKYGYRTDLAHTLTQSHIVPWDPSAKAIMSFSSDCTIRNFCDYFLSDVCKAVDEIEVKMKQSLTKATYDSVIKDKLNVLPIFVSMLRVRFYFLDLVYLLIILFR